MSAGRDPRLPNSYDTMRFLLAGVGSSVVNTGLTLKRIMAGGASVTLVYVADDGREVRDYLDIRGCEGIQ